MKKHIKFSLPLILVGFLSIFLFANFSNQQTTIEMKTYPLIEASPIIFEGNFEEDWKKLDELSNHSFVKDGYTYADSILNRAKELKNEEAFIMALIYKAKFKNLTEYNPQQTIDFLELEIKHCESQSLKSLLHTYLAEFYFNTYNTDSYKINNRSTSNQKDRDDIETWSYSDFMSEIDHHFQEALKYHEHVKTISASSYKKIITHYGDLDLYSLYDLVAQRAINFYKNTQASLDQPSYYFEINSVAFFDEPNTFCEMQFVTKDSLNFKLKVLSLYQDLVKYHLPRIQQDELVKTDLDRIKFIETNYVLGDKEELLENYLLAGIEKHQDKKAVLPYVHELALYYARKVEFYQVNDNHEPSYAQQAINLVEKYESLFLESEYNHHLYRIKEILNTEYFETKFPRINTGNKKSLAYIQFRNIDKVELDIYKLDREHLLELNNFYGDEVNKYIENNEPLKHHVVKWDKPTDYKTHALEFEFPALDYGFYLIATHSNESGEPNYNYMQITDLAYFKNKDSGDEQKYQIVNRNSGDPISDVEVKIFRQEYQKDKYKHRLIKSIKPTQDGEFTLKYMDLHEQRDYRIELNKGKDSFIPFDHNYFYGYYPDNEIDYNTTLFTDRSIYRPGQTVYFKGIKTQKVNHSSTILVDQSVTVTLYTPSHQVIKHIPLQTNEFGTYSGSFILPTDGVTGEYSIREGNGTSYISIEEYKRPKFEVTIDPLDKDYKVKDSIKISGNTFALAGYGIEGATVKYTVNRQTNLPWWCRWYYTKGENVVIAKGNAETNEKGEFNLTFFAKPDGTIDIKNDPSFSYSIEVDITDLNGETRSATKTISLSYKSLYLSSNLSHELILNNTKEFSVYASNVAGKEIATKGKYKISKLKTPERAILEKKWGKSDLFIIDEKTYLSSYPHSQYKPTKSFEIENLILSGEFDTEKSKEISLKKISNAKSGKYLLELSSFDKDGNEVIHKQEFTITDDNPHQVPTNELIWTKTDKFAYQPDETAEITIGSKENITLWYSILKGREVLEFKKIKLDNNILKIQFPITETHRGNLSFQYGFVFQNHFESGNKTISVPYSNKELTCTFETFRDKLQPGEKEEWRIKLTGSKAEKVTAEMVATLYDASLDQIKEHNWYANFFDNFYSPNQFETQIDEGVNEIKSNYLNTYFSDFTKTYSLKWFDYNFYSYRHDYPTKSLLSRNNISLQMAAPSPSMEASEEMLDGTSDLSFSANDSQEVIKEKKVYKKEMKKDEDILEKQEEKKEDVQIRTNFNETAFFYPHLQTNAEGEIFIKFTAPESLTKWKMLGFAHTKDLKSTITTNSLVTQKDLMVVPNAPRFFREGDKVVFSTKIVSLIDTILEGNVSLEFFDGITFQKRNDILSEASSKAFSLNSKSSEKVTWKMTIPQNIDALTYRIVAKSAQHSDGEEMLIPVVKNRMMVTETLPFYIRKGTNKKLTVDKLQNKSATSSPHRLTLEFTENPAWYALQALPYLMEYPHECAEQTFSRYYANSIAAQVLNSSPKIKQVFDTWKNIQPEALISKLEKNEELKNILLEETPWVLEGKDETENHRRLGLLFDLNRMANEKERAIKRLKDLQLSNGAWSWFEGMKPNTYITQHIISGMSKLHHKKTINVIDDSDLGPMLKNAVKYLDNNLYIEYEELKVLARKKKLKLEDYHTSSATIHYLYARSNFKEIQIAEKHQEAFNYYIGQCDEYWKEQSLYMQGMTALILHRNGNTKTTQKLIKSFRQRAIQKDEKGMYWDITAGYYWYQSPIETHTLMMEVFDEIEKDTKAVDEMKIWLIANKRTNGWNTTKSTTEACFALLMQGSDVLSASDETKIFVGKEEIYDSNPQKEAGTGYFKKSWNGNEITSEKGNISIQKPENSSLISYGGIYYQYFEDLDKIVGNQTPLQLKKSLFVERSTDSGKKLELITPQTNLHVGDKLVSQLVIKSDRDMEYIHIKDMRSSCLEPTDVISSYHYQDGLGYYQSTRDIATHFFIGYLPKGNYTLEYEVFVTHEGNYSNGISTIQSMYAPEFASHTSGTKIQIVK